MTLARRTDPSTSHEAARRSKPRANADAQRILAFVVASPGLTAAEIAQALLLERHVPSRRLPELRAAGKVTSSDKRRCTVQGSTSMTWRAVVKPAVQGRLW